MWRSSDLHVMFIFSCTDEIQRFDKKKTCHEKMDPMNGLFVSPASVAPETEESNVAEEEERVESW